MFQVDFLFDPNWAELKTKLIWSIIILKIMAKPMDQV